MKTLITICIFIQMLVSLSSAGYAENEKKKAVEALSEKMNQIRNNKPISIDDRGIITEDEVLILDELTKFEKDSSPKVRVAAYAIGWKIATSSNSVKTRQEVVNRLLQASQDPEPLVWQQANKRLLSFNSKDFSGTAQDNIIKYISKKEPEFNMIKVSGVANIHSAKSRLEELLIDETKYDSSTYGGKWYGSVGWAARLSLARMGGKKDIDRAIKMIESETNPVIRVTQLLQDLAFIRQPEAITVLQRYLNSDERLPKLKPMIPGTQYNQYALDLLAQIIEGFPIKSVGPGGYSQSEIELARKWMSNKNNWINSISK